MFSYLKRMVKVISSLRVDIHFSDRADQSVVKPVNRAKAHFEIIGLENVKREYLAHWPAINQRVHQIVQRIIRDHLLSGEDFHLSTADSYIVFFERDIEQSKRCANKIRTAIMDIFIVDLKMKALSLNAEVYPAIEDETDLAMALRRGNPQGSQRPERKFYIRPSVETSTIGVRAFDDEEDDDRPLLRRDEDGRAMMPAGIEHVLSPVFSAIDNKSTCHAIYPRLEMGGAKTWYGYDVLPLEADEDMVLELDIMTVNRLTEIMDKMVEQTGATGKVLCPVSYETIIDDRRREKYLQAYAQLQRKGYDKTVAIQLYHMPRALYGYDLRKPVEILTKLSQRVVVMMSSDWTASGELSAAGARAIGFDYHEVEKMQMDMMRLRMRGFVKQANRERVASYIFGVNGAAKDVAACAGFGYICDMEVAPRKIEEVIDFRDVAKPPA
jgi:hypothetical protein